MRKMLKYPPRKCTVCAAEHTNKTMCDKHLKLSIGIPYMPTEQERRAWESEPEPSPRWRRKENIDQLR